MKSSRRYFFGIALGAALAPVAKLLPPPYAAPIQAAYTSPPDLAEIVANTLKARTAQMVSNVTSNSALLARLKNHQGIN